MDSEGHRAAILYPWYKKVSIGLAWDTYNFWTAQLFEGDYVVYEHLPSLSHGRLDLTGAVKNGVTFEGPRELDCSHILRPDAPCAHQRPGRKNLLPTMQAAL